MSRAPKWFAQKRGKKDANHLTICRALKKLRIFHVDTSGVGDGVLDLLVYDRLNNPYWVELKTPKGELTPKQLLFIAELEARGIAWGVAKTLDAVLALIGVRA